MGFGDLCFKPGGDLAYSKVDDSSLIYKGQWRITIDWTGSYYSNTAYGAHTAVYTGARVSSHEWTFEGGSTGGFRLLWSDSEVWVKNYLVGQSVFFTEPESYDAHIEGNAIVFYFLGYYVGYHGFIGSCFSNSSSDPEAAYSQVYTSPVNPSRWTIADVSVTLAWV